MWHVGEVKKKSHFPLQNVLIPLYINQRQEFKMDIQKILEISVSSTDVQFVDRSFLQGRIFFPLTPSYNTPLPTQSILVSSPLTIGRLSNDDGDGKENGKKAIGLY